MLPKQHVGEFGLEQPTPDARSGLAHILKPL